MIAYQSIAAEQQTSNTKALIFAGDGVRLSGQIDYPSTAPSSDKRQSFPLMLILPHACHTRDMYQPYADIALAAGYAVFRYDKRGTGRSGACARGSVTQDAVNAYEVALEQPRIDRKRAVILAHGSGTGIIGNAFGLFARVERPAGVILMTNLLDEDAVLAIESPVQIIIAQDDWNPWEKFGKAAAENHAKAYHYEPNYYVVPNADRLLLKPHPDTQTMPAGLREVITDWLQNR
ncbi:MAG: hypothetical protein D6737_08365 [Chloroflexi bacterium]|nr:MAG: hypothetical protein D6737_08365 [Chloroflexota bacterium]